MIENIFRGDWAAVRRDTIEPNYTIKKLTPAEQQAFEALGLTIKYCQTRDSAREYAREQRNIYDGIRGDAFDQGMGWQYRSFKRVVPVAVQQYELIGDDLGDK